MMKWRRQAEAGGNLLLSRQFYRRRNIFGALILLLVFVVSFGYILQQESQATVFGPAIGAKSLGLGYASSCVVGADNQAHCWGMNTTGHLGDGTTTVSHNPVNVISEGALSGKKVLSVGSGGNHSCALASDNQVYCWGSGTAGRLGTGGTTGSATPVAVDTTGVLSGKTIKTLEVGHSFTCVIASDNQVYCWGLGIDGQLGNNDPSNGDALSPVAVYTGGVLSGKTINSLSVAVTHVDETEEPTTEKGDLPSTGQAIFWVIVGASILILLAILLISGKSKRRR
ncbi:LPXTG cell wall anchor domain-containing protein [Candidatus Saccharibacteria bacterium]|nr:LPXTG cell wall anchor domain-containing protein [Candidatus Saccharibacteria bacterium]